MHDHALLRSLIEKKIIMSKYSTNYVLIDFFLSIFFNNLFLFLSTDHYNLIYSIGTIYKTSIYINKLAKPLRKRKEKM